MTHLTREQAKKLAEVKAPACISIYLPAHPRGAEVLSGKDHLMLKTCLNDAKEILIQEKGMGKKEAEAFLQQGYALAENSDVWRTMENGLAVFIQEGKIGYYKLPFSVDCRTYVADHFYLLPLVASFSGDGKFFILSLSLNQTRLFSCGRESIHEIYIKTGEEVKVGETAPPLKASFHGSGDRIDDRKVEMESFLNELDKKVCGVVHSESAPLVIASVEYVHSLYSKVSNYKHIFREFIKENPEHESLESLHKKAWELVKNEFEKNKNEEWKKFESGLGRGNSTTQIEEILTQAESGRVEALFVNPALAIWGKLNSSGKTEVHTQREAGDIDLANKVAISVFQHGGKLFSKTDGLSTGVAGVFRY